MDSAYSKCPCACAFLRGSTECIANTHPLPAGICSASLFPRFDLEVSEKQRIFHITHKMYFIIYLLFPVLPFLAETMRALSSEPAGGYAEVWHCLTHRRL